MTTWNHASMEPPPPDSGPSHLPAARPGPTAKAPAPPPLHYRVHEIGYVLGFRCVPEQCQDLCCHRYSLIAVDDATHARCASDAPELLRHFARHDDGHRMAMRDGRCSALRGRHCSIHARYGPSFQPEICHFYPRQVLRLGSNLFVTSVLSCFIMLQRAISAGADTSWHDADWERVPEHLPDLLADRFPGATVQDALAVHDRVLRMVDAHTSEEALSVLLVVAGLLDGSPRERWPCLLDRHLPLLHRDMLLELGQGATVDSAGGPWRVEGFLSMLGSLARAPHHRAFGRLALAGRSLVLERGIPWTRRAMTEPAWLATAEPCLKRYLKARLCESLFPLSPWGTCLDDAWLLAACACVLRLGLLAGCQGADPVVSADAFTQAASAVEYWLHGRRQEVYDHVRPRGWLDLRRMTTLLLEGRPD